MLRPLNALEVHAFLDKFPQGTHLSELGDMSYSQLDSSVNFCCCGEPTQTKSA